MSVKINYTKQTTPKSSTNIVLFSDEKFKLNGVKKYLSNNEFSYVSELLKTSDLKKNLFVFEVNSKKKIILLSIKNKNKNFDFENLGGEFYKRINHGKNAEYCIISDSVDNKFKDLLGHFLHGLKLKSYEFNKYKTKKNLRQISINIVGNKNKPSYQIK